MWHRRLCFHKKAASLSLNYVVRHAGPCARCEMVCTDQEAGKRGGPEPLLTLAAYRRTRGRIHFGVLLDHAPTAGSEEMLQVGAAVDVQHDA